MEQNNNNSKLAYDEIENDALETYSTQGITRRIVLLSVALIAVAVASFTLGRYELSLPDMLQAIFEQLRYCVAVVQAWAHNLFNPEAPVVAQAVWSNPMANAALFEIRLPRILFVIFVGMGLSVAGASYQGMFKNPLVSPDLLGASAGAGFGACLAILIGLPSVGIMLCAFVGGMLAVSLVMLANRVVRADALLGLIMGGILVGTLFQSGTSMVKLLADASDKLPAITFWLMGSFASSQSGDLFVLLPMAVGFVFLLTQRWNLNVLSFGEEEAQSLGVNTSRTRLLVIVGATLLTSCSVAIAGVIGWIGLVVPHLTRALVGPNYRVLLPTTMLVGALFLLLVDDVARLSMAVEIPIGLLTAVLGVPFFAFIYRRNTKGW